MEVYVLKEVFAVLRRLSSMTFGFVVAFISFGAVAPTGKLAACWGSIKGDSEETLEVHGRPD
jgi:hypothetical protein